MAIQGSHSYHGSSSPLLAKVHSPAIERGMVNTAILYTLFSLSTMVSKGEMDIRATLSRTIPSIISPSTLVTLCTANHDPLPSVISGINKPTSFLEAICTLLSINPKKGHGSHPHGRTRPLPSTTARFPSMISLNTLRLVYHDAISVIFPRPENLEEEWEAALAFLKDLRYDSNHKPLVEHVADIHRKLLTIQYAPLANTSPDEELNFKWSALIGYTDWATRKPYARSLFQKRMCSLLFAKDAPQPDLASEENLSEVCAEKSIDSTIEILLYSVYDYIKETKEARVGYIKKPFPPELPDGNLRIITGQTHVHKYLNGLQEHDVAARKVVNMINRKYSAPVEGKSGKRKRSDEREEGSSPRRRSRLF